MTEQVLDKKVKKGVRRPYALQSDIGFLLHDVSRLRRTVFDKVLKPLGITRTQWWLLVNLSRLEGKGISQSDLAAQMQVGKVTIGAMLVLLENCSYIERRATESDGRVKLIFITDAGHATLEQARQLSHFMNRAILAGASDDQIRATEDLLRLLKQNLLTLDGDMKSE